MGCSPDDSACIEIDPFANENPRHRVIISKGFWMGQTEVTVGAYKNIVSGPVDDYQLKQNGNIRLAREVKLRNMIVWMISPGMQIIRVI